ncbi:DUF1573 domain-containing protein [Mariniflexile maritimum]|uniref:DUF1573 domain-containing protein n=1 Tax=Mariniflexile maritimum TaxID=2682493 RepID=UPI0012F6F537|nr:DUF1573 domain-containing protein [Mariniflexile maritimum]
MKKLIFGFCLLNVMAFTSCKDNASNKVHEANVTAAAERDANALKFPVIEFNETEHDFGAIERNQPVETTFSYKNTGNAPLVITDIKTSCGCTVPEGWSKDPLAPGETGSFSIKFNGSGSNKITKTITVSANTEKGSEVVKITAFVKPDPNENPAAAAVH